VLLLGRRSLKKMHGGKAKQVVRTPRPTTAAAVGRLASSMGHTKRASSSCVGPALLESQPCRCCCCCCCCRCRSARSSKRGNELCSAWTRRVASACRAVPVVAGHV
jgi:hypothetical protein